jgi:sec-independent protein translocase protein TatC
MSNGNPPDPDDFFAETRMSFGDHIEELRVHLWRAIYGFGIAVFASIFIGHIVVDYITAPVKQQLREYYIRHQKRVLEQQAGDPELTRANRPTPFRAVLVPRKQILAVAKGEDPDMPRPRIISEKEQQAREEQKAPLWKRLLTGEWFPSDPEKDPAWKDRPDEKPVEIAEKDKEKEFVRLWMSVENPIFYASDLQPAQRAFLDLDNPTTLNVQEGFMVWFKVCMVSGVVLGSPWIFWQIWMFVAAGLYPHEKRLVHVYLPVSLGLFLAGVVICEVFVLPKAIEALLWFNELMNLRPDVRLNEWLGFAIFMPLVFGLSFQTPLVMLFLNRLGIMDIDSFRNRRKMAWFAMAVFAAVITPSTDALSMLFLWVPMSLLFELGIFLIWFSPRHQTDLDVETSDLDEMVEV